MKQKSRRIVFSCCIGLILFLVAIGFFNFSRSIERTLLIKYQPSEKEKKNLAPVNFAADCEENEFFVILIKSDQRALRIPDENIDFLAAQLAEIVVDKTGNTWDRMESLSDEIRFNSMMLKAFPDFFRRFKSDFYRKIQKQNRDLDTIFPPVGDRMKIVTGTKKELDLPNDNNGEKTAAVVVCLRSFSAGEMMGGKTSMKERKRIRKFIRNYHQETLFQVDRILRMQKKLDADQNLEFHYSLIKGSFFSKTH